MAEDREGVAHSLAKGPVLQQVVHGIQGQVEDAVEQVRQGQVQDEQGGARCRSKSKPAHARKP